MRQTSGVVVKVFGLHYRVEYGKGFVNCVLRGRMRRNRDLESFSAPVAVGDRVKIELLDDSTGAISEVMPRKNVFSRKEKGRHSREDVIAANLDLIVVLQSFRKPRLNLRFVDRLYVRARRNNIAVLLCVNKLDLADDEMMRYIESYYASAKLEICLVSALNGQGIDELKRRLGKAVSLLVGHSGVGKTSILKTMYPDLDLRVAEVSESTGKGRHTTTNVEMIPLGDGTFIIDTPGLREFGLMDFEPHTIGNYFYEFERYTRSCSFQPCTHDHEPGCAIKKKVGAGRIHEDRYGSYLNLLYSVKESRGAKY